MRSASAFLVLAFWQDGFCWETTVPILFLSLKSWTACSSFPNLSSRCWSGLWGSNLCYLDKLVSVAYSHNQANNKEKKKKKKCVLIRSQEDMGYFWRMGLKAMKLNSNSGKKKKKSWLLRYPMARKLTKLPLVVSVGKACQALGASECCCIINGMQKLWNMGSCDFLMTIKAEKW